MVPMKRLVLHGIHVLWGFKNYFPGPQKYAKYLPKHIQIKRSQKGQLFCMVMGSR